MDNGDCHLICICVCDISCSKIEFARVAFVLRFSVFLCLCAVLRMCLVRLKTEGKDGKFMFKKLVQMMWFDVEERIKNLGVGISWSN